MTITSGNLLDAVSAVRADEEVTTLFQAPRMRVERIVSHGHASPPGFWYDQDWSEWVMLVSGSAGLRIEGEAAPRSLKAGDYVVIPPHIRHRVEWTASDATTVWLAIHDRGTA